MFCDMKLSSLSILIPAYKDEKTISTVIHRALLAGRTYAKKFEIVVLNDASPDRLSLILRTLKRTIPELRIVTHATNQGYGETVKDLYYAGKNAWLFTAPGDYQIDPMELKKFVPYANTADMIIGWRKERNDTQSRKRQSFVYNGLLKLLFGISVHDINSIRLMKRNIFKKRTIISSSAFVDAELTIGAIRDGFQVIETHILHRNRTTRGASGGKLKIIIPVIIDMFLYKLRNFV